VVGVGRTRLEIAADGATFAGSQDIDGPGDGGTPRGPAPKYMPSMQARRYSPCALFEAASAAVLRCPTERRAPCPAPPARSTATSETASTSWSAITWEP